MREAVGISGGTHLYELTTSSAGALTLQLQRMPNLILQHYKFDRRFSILNITSNTQKKIVFDRPERKKLLATSCWPSCLPIGIFADLIGVPASWGFLCSPTETKSENLVFLLFQELESSSEDIQYQSAHTRQKNERTNEKAIAYTD